VDDEDKGDRLHLVGRECKGEEDINISLIITVLKQKCYYYVYFVYAPYVLNFFYLKEFISNK